ncbi:hypothetical protein GCM10027418_17020 [Mariniluteicoccus endophyticus]
MTDGTAYDIGLMPAMLLVSVSAVILGVTAMSSEYARNSTDAGGSRQVVPTLVAQPRRSVVLVAKAAAVALATIAVAWSALALSVAAATVAMGEHALPGDPPARLATRVLGGTLYWVLLAWIALAVATLARSGVVPLALLIVNCAVVPVSLLLARVTSLAQWAPDLAGRSLFGLPDELVVPGGPAAVPGGMAMAAWTLGLLALAGAYFVRRDA